MTLRTAHGSYAASGATVVVETLPADEMPNAVPVDLALLPDPIQRRADGTLADSSSAQAIGRRGGLSKAYRRKGLEGLGLVELNEEHDLYKYWKAAGAYMGQVKEEYALASGGTLGAAGSAILGNSAVLLAAIKFYSDQFLTSTDPKERDKAITKATNLMDKHKALCLCALEIALRIGGTRKQKSADPFAIIARVQDPELGYVEVLAADAKREADAPMPETGD